MLRKIRITLASIFFIGITLLFLDFTGTAHAWLGWMSRIQFLPAVLALNIAVIVGLVALTLIFGRIYCSTICPLGVFQDLVIWLRGRGKNKKYRFKFRPALKWVRLVILALFVAMLIFGVASIAMLIAPYGAYGRIASNLFAPIWAAGNNLLAMIAERVDSYAFYSTDIVIASLSTFVIALVTMIAIVAIAWVGGRTYCNTICPVGTVLGYISKFSLLKIRIDTEKCNSCGLCSRRCKASCINGKAHEVDYTRCVACMDCIDTCRHGAISYTFRRKAAPKQQPTDQSRRSFLTITGAVAASAAFSATAKKVDGGLAAIEDKKAPKRATKIVPFGAASIRNFEQHCVACQQCVAVCPNNVLRPSSDLGSLMQPEVSYENGYCRPECVKCSQVCPTGSIRPITVEEKSAIQIGHAVVIPANCLLYTEGTECGNCARHCPVGAIDIINCTNDPSSPRIPVVDTERCIGCGACEYLCPSRPFSAIYVEGHEVHRNV